MLLLGIRIYSARHLCDRSGEEVRETPNERERMIYAHPNCYHSRQQWFVIRRCKHQRWKNGYGNYVDSRSASKRATTPIQWRAEKMPANKMTHPWAAYGREFWRLTAGPHLVRRQSLFFCKEWRQKKSTGQHSCKTYIEPRVRLYLKNIQLL